MSNYSENEGSCRASLFKPSGKWYQDLAIDMSAFYNEPDIHMAIRCAFEQTARTLQSDWKLVVLDPYHKNSHPIMLIGR